MMKHFRSSPLWLIGLFIMFAQATAGIAAVQIDGWPQSALVVFVISYSAIVTIIFFVFLWKKPENFYSPTDYSNISPWDFQKGLRGIPSETTEAVIKYESNPDNKKALYSLMANLLPEAVKQHIVLMRKNNNKLDVSKVDEMGATHHYEIISRNGGISAGMFIPDEFLRKTNGTGLVDLSPNRREIVLSQQGVNFGDWLIENELDAETFNSDKGQFGLSQSISEVLDRRFGKNR